MEEPKPGRGTHITTGIMFFLVLLLIGGTIYGIVMQNIEVMALREDVQELSNRLNAMQIEVVEADSRSETNQYNVGILATSDMLNLINDLELTNETPCAEITSAISHLTVVISTSSEKYTDYEESVEETFEDLINANRGEKEVVRNLQHIQSCLAS